MSKRTTNTILLFLLLGAAALAQGSSEREQSFARRHHLQHSAAELVLAWLEAHQYQKPPISLVDSAELQRTWPDALFYHFSYPQFPVARMVPKGLSYSNLAVLDGAGKVALVSTVAALERLFRERVAPPRSEHEVEPLLYAWLQLAEQLFQDGYVQFQRPSGVNVAAPGGRFEAHGKCNVVPNMGNSGYIDAGLYFDSNGHLLKAVADNHVRTGIRPKCQATKLLDRDPVVRAMAEQDILVMGKACHAYLLSQRAKASPRLRRAIDRVWARIQAEGR